MLGARTSIDAAHALIGLGLDAAVVQDFERATTINNEVVCILRGLRDVEPSAAQIESSILNNLADIAFNEGDDQRAIRLAEEALAQQRLFGFRWAAMDALFILALVAHRMGNLAQAAAYCRESLDAWDRRDPQQIPLILDLVALLANASGQTTAAARLIGAAKHLYVRLGLPRGTENERAISAIRNGLGKAQFEAAHADGWRLPIEHATAEAIALAEALSLSLSGRH
jgi:tetratricopeptide (TPR) repeat protein